MWLIEMQIRSTEFDAKEGCWDNDWAGGIRWSRGNVALSRCFVISILMSNSCDETLKSRRNTRTSRLPITSAESFFFFAFCYLKNSSPEKHGTSAH